MRSLKHKHFLVLIMLITLLALLPAVTLAQDEDGEEILTHCNPVALRLAETVGVECDKLLELLAKGHGLGQVMQAVYLVESTGDLTDVEALLLQKEEEGIGWGQLKMARRMAGEDGDAGLMLELKQAGMGWGQIKKIQDLVDSEMGYEEAIGLLKLDSEWKGEGPPPWAASGKDKVKNGNGNGPPAWSNAGGNDKSEEDNEAD